MTAWTFRHVVVAVGISTDDAGLGGQREDTAEASAVALGAVEIADAASGTPWNEHKTGGEGQTACVGVDPRVHRQRITRTTPQRELPRDPGHTVGAPRERPGEMSANRPAARWRPPLCLRRAASRVLAPASGPAPGQVVVQSRSCRAIRATPSVPVAASCTSATAALGG